MQHVRCPSCGSSDPKYRRRAPFESHAPSQGSCVNRWHGTANNVEPVPDHAVSGDESVAVGFEDAGAGSTTRSYNTANNVGAGEEAARRSQPGKGKDPFDSGFPAPTPSSVDRGDIEDGYDKEVK